MPTSTVEDYLKAIWLEEQRPRGAAYERLVGMGQIAQALEVAPGTVTAMVKTLERAASCSTSPIRECASPTRAAGPPPTWSAATG